MFPWVKGSQECSNQETYPLTVVTLKFGDLLYGGLGALGLCMY